MTVQEKKEYLKQYKRAIAKIKALEEELNDLRLNTLPGGIDYSKDKVQTTATSDQMINYMIHVEDISKKININKQLAVMKCNAILEAIDSVDNDLYQTILHRRYILIQPWEEIAEDLHYSMQRLYELHGEALAEVHIIKEQSKSE